LRLAVVKSSSSALTALAWVAWPWLALERVAQPQAPPAGGARTPATLAWAALAWAARTPATLARAALAWAALAWAALAWAALA
jgi:hypothetical protein